MKWILRAGFAGALFLAAAFPALANTVTLVVPSAMLGSALYGGITGQSYTPDAFGYVTVDSQDAPGFLALGIAPPPSGLSPNPLKLIEGKNSNGTTLAASASSGEFGLSLTPGTSEYLTGEAAESNTKTDNVVWEYVLPANYHGGKNLTLSCDGLYSGSGTAGTVTLAGAAYLVAAADTMGSTLIATAAQALTTSNAAYAFTVTGTALAPGDRLILEVTAAVQETGGSATLTGKLNSCSIG